MLKLKKNSSLKETHNAENSSKVTENSSKYFSKEKMIERIILQPSKHYCTLQYKKEFSDGLF